MTTGSGTSPVEDLRGITCVVTGATSGIGRATATALVRRGAHVVLACRSAAKARRVIDELAATAGTGRAEHVHLDLSDLSSVRACAQELRARGTPVHRLINNAGISGEVGTTAQGFEVAFGVNHLGHFLLTTLLLDRLRQSRPARVVTLSSLAHRFVRTVDLDAVTAPTRTASGMHEYAVSKLCNLLFTQELARRLAGRGVTAYAVHPGYIDSGLEVFRQVPPLLRPLIDRLTRPPEVGARTTLHCVAAPGIERFSGGYFAHCSHRRASPFATPTLAAELWRRSEAWVAGAVGSGSTRGQATDDR